MKNVIRKIVCGMVFLVAFFFIYSGSVFAGSDEMFSIIFNRNLEKYIYQEGYCVFQNENLLERFNTYEEAKKYAEHWAHATLIFRGKVWTNLDGEKQKDFEEGPKNTPLSFSPFRIYQEDKLIAKEHDFSRACKYARQLNNASVYGDVILWDNYGAYYYVEDGERKECFGIKEYLEQNTKNSAISALFYAKDDKLAYEKVANLNHRITGVPCIAQNPELPRGCEVTSLAMVLKYSGIDVSKMTLAKEIEKISQKEDPNKGFIGDMYSLKTFGLGVYHSPVAKLAKKYAGESVIDLTGCEFEDLYYYIKNDHPIWVINNSRFRHLEESYFTYWNTPSGKIKITYKEHSVVVTGIDDQFVYINDPLTGGTRKVNKVHFINGWEQMGRQCIVIDKI